MPLSIAAAIIGGMRSFVGISLLILPCALASAGPLLDLPPRPPTAPGGTEFAASIAALPAPPDSRREELIWAQITNGNIPGWMRTLRPVLSTNSVNGTNHVAEYFVTPDYFCVGSDADYLLMPMTPALAQRVADRCGCSLVTRKMADDIWRQASVRLTPSPMTPGPAMTGVPAFTNHNNLVREQRQAAVRPLGELVAGDKKDIVISALMLTNFHRSRTPVVIYGWHQPNGRAIQPLYNGHAGWWADYSHGVRLAFESMTLDGAPTTVSAVLTNPATAALLSDETNFPGNTIPRPYYETNPPPPLPAP